jgi:hypothetical protein
MIKNPPRKFQMIQVAFKQVNLNLNLLNPTIYQIKEKEIRQEISNMTTNTLRPYWQVKDLIT